MPWSPTPATPERQHRTAWFPAPPAPHSREHLTAWFPRYRLKPSDTGIGQDVAAAFPRIPAIDTGIGLDRALLSRITELLADGAVGADTALLTPKLYVADSGLGAGAARPGVRPTGQGVGGDSGVPRPRFAVVDAAVGADMLTSLRPRTTATDQGRGADTATNGFTPKAAALTSYTTPGTYQYRIPVWCRYVEIVLCGSGRGGNGNSNALPGAGGNAGGWAAVTLERGVDIPWTLLDITIVVKDGGAGGAGSVFVGSAGTDGAASTAAVSGTVILSAPGGTGERSGNQSGGSPGNYSYGGQSYTGGAETTTGNGTVGNPPGGGGRGGNGNTFGGFAGGKGAAGVGHVRARQ
ncbi:hypothetical protein [Mycolicibacterium fortuitum]|uniref:glycine-rich domain-containing protein n=1 Tax=Mycolicibacterium fortuitum TaxID=1766 RepID=UPI002602EA41|nr:hypothetical protein [Mycolicibacterium fortuitum]